MQAIQRRIMVVLLAGGIFLVATGAWAHHSNAMFDADVITEITGTVREFQWTNPHSWIHVDVATASGQSTTWAVEWGSPNSLGRRGFRSNTFPSGARVTIQINPMRDGSPGGVFVAAKFEDGTTVGTWGE